MIGQKIRQLRLDRKMTQDEIGKILKISGSAVGMYENGVRNPSYEILVTLATYFGVSADYLLGLVDKESESINYPTDPYTVLIMHAKKEAVDVDKLRLMIEILKGSK